MLFICWLVLITIFHNVALSLKTLSRYSSQLKSCFYRKRVLDIVHSSKFRTIRPNFSSLRTLREIFARDFGYYYMIQRCYLKRQDDVVAVVVNATIYVCTPVLNDNMFHVRCCVARINHNDFQKNIYYRSATCLENMFVKYDAKQCI
jgi:hypothetical protein